MESFKIKKIKNLNDLKNVYSFISYTFFSDSMKEGEELLPFHELYEVMIDNLAINKDLQFYGVVEKNIVSAVVASELPYDKKCLLVNIFYVREISRGNGFANIMLSEVETLAKKKGFERIRIIYNDLSYEFFKKHEYEIYLELAIPETLPVKDIFKINNLPLRNQTMTLFNNINFVEYYLEEADWRVKNRISKNTPLVKAKFILEKKLG